MKFLYQVENLKRISIVELKGGQETAGCHKNKQQFHDEILSELMSFQSPRKPPKFNVQLNEQTKLKHNFILK